MNDQPRQVHTLNSGQMLSEHFRRLYFGAAHPAAALFLQEYVSRPTEVRV